MLSRITPFVLAVAPLAAQNLPSAHLDAVTVRSGAALASAPAAGSEVWSGGSAFVNGNTGTASLALQHAANATGVDVQWQLACQANAATSSVASASVRYELPTTAAGVGILSILWLTNTSGTGATQLAIDVGDDGVVDAVGIDALPVVFAPGAFVVRVTASVQATASTVQMGWSTWHLTGAAQAALVLRLAPDGVTSSVVAPPCGNVPAALSAAATFADGVGFVGTLDPSSDLGVLVLGLHPAAVPLGLPPGCSLAVAPDLVAWQVPDAARAVVWQLAVPQALRPFALQAQLVGLAVAPLAAVTSPALLVQRW